MKIIMTLFECKRGFLKVLRVSHRRRIVFLSLDIILLTYQWQLLRLEEATHFVPTNQALFVHFSVYYKSKSFVFFTWAPLMRYYQKNMPGPMSRLIMERVSLHLVCFNKKGPFMHWKSAFILAIPLKLTTVTSAVCCVQHQQKGNKMGDEKDKRDRDLNLSVSLSYFYVKHFLWTEEAFN